MNGVLEITIPIMDTCRLHQAMISSMLKSIEFLTPHTGLLILYYIRIVIYMYFFSSLQCKLLKPEMTMPKKSGICPINKQPCYCDVRLCAKKKEIII